VHCFFVFLKREREKKAKEVEARERKIIKKIIGEF